MPADGARWQRRALHGVRRFGQHVLLGASLITALATVTGSVLTRPAAATVSSLAQGTANTAVATGVSDYCVITGGNAYCRGSNANGQLDDNSTTNSSAPVLVAPQASASEHALPGTSAPSTPAAASPSAQATGNASARATAITAGAAQSCALQAGRAYCWGSNRFGGLGDGTTTQRNGPVAVTSGGVLAGKTLTQVRTGGAHTCALDSAGAAYCWGDNSSGQLGNNSTTSSSVPVAVSTAGVLSGKTLIQISAGDSYTCALDSAGAAYCWGDNTSGRLGNGTTSNSSVPMAVDTSGVLAGVTLTEIATGQNSVCALGSTGAAYCWGYGGYGNLGNGSTANSSVPVAVDTSGVLAGVTLTQATTGPATACAIDTAGLAYCWGDGQLRALGYGSTTSSSVPVAVTTSGVLAGTTLSHISSGYYTTCALDSTGAAYCWGYGNFGSLGNNATADSSVPVAVSTAGVLAGKSLTQISTYGYHTCALDSASTAYCWGYDAQGQLGYNNSSSADSSVPVVVVPQAPTSVAGAPGDTTATISWTAPAYLNQGTITSYLASATPGAATCATTGTLTCNLTGLTDGTTYTVMVTVTATTGTSIPSNPALVTPAGILSITVPAAATLPSAAPGTTTSAALGTVTVTDNRGLASAAWTATVSTTTFTIGGGTALETIPTTDISYWSGPATATTGGGGTYTPGQATSADAQVLNAPRTAFTLTGGAGNNAASWNPTLVVAVPASAIAGSYTATITHAVS